MSNEEPQAKSKLKTEQRRKWAAPNWGVIECSSLRRDLEFRIY